MKISYNNFFSEYIYINIESVILNTSKTSACWIHVPKKTEVSETFSCSSEKCLKLSLGFTSQQHRPMNVNSSAMLLALYLRVSFQNQFRLHTLRFIYMFPDLRLVMAYSFGE